MIGALLLIVSEFEALYSITVDTVVKKTVVGHSQHSYGLLLIGLAALGLAAATFAAQRARAAMAAIALLGVVALLIALVGDLPDVNSTGVVGQLYAEAGASAKIGFYMETLGAVALIFSGISMLFLSGPVALPGGVRSRRARAGASRTGADRAGTGRGSADAGRGSTGPIDAEDAGWL